MTHHAETEKVLQVVDGITDEIVEFAADLVRIPTVNPPGALYEVCAHTIGERLKSFGFSVNYVAAEGLPEHTPTHPRVNVIGSRVGSVSRPLLHLNGHFDVVDAANELGLSVEMVETKTIELMSRGKIKIQR